MSPELTEITVEIMASRKAALLVTDGQTEAWLPKSQIEYDEDAEPGDTVEIEAPEWLLIKKDLA